MFVNLLSLKLGRWSRSSYSMVDIALHQQVVSYHLNSYCHAICLPLLQHISLLLLFQHALPHNTWWVVRSPLLTRKWQRRLGTTADLLVEVMLLLRHAWTRLVNGLMEMLVSGQLMLGMATSGYRFQYKCLCKDIVASPKCAIQFVQLYMPITQGFIIFLSYF